MTDGPLFKQNIVESNFPNFTELEAGYLRDIAKARQVDEINFLMENIGANLKPKWLNEEEKLRIKRIKQKAHEKKKVIANSSAREAIADPDLWVAQVQKAITVPEQKPQTKETSKPPKVATIQQPKMPSKSVYDYRGHLFLCSSIACVGTLVLKQTIPLYEASGFTEPVIAGIGAVVIMIGYPIYHAFSKTWFSIALCGLACIYEISFVYSGTHEDEHSAVEQAINNNPDVKWLNEQIAKAKMSYEEGLQRYEDPKQDVYHNGWYRKTVLNPRWESLEKLQTERRELEKNLVDAAHGSWMTPYLKMLYRLALVVMCMLAVHRFAMLQK